MKYSRSGIFFGLNIFADEFLAKVSEVESVLDGASGGRERLGRAEFVIFHHTVAAGNKFHHCAAALLFYRW